MHLVILAVGARLPSWAQAACDEYAKRFPPDLPLEVRPIKAESRTGGKTPAQCMAAEHARIAAHLSKRCHTIALDERGAAVTSEKLACRLAAWRALGCDAYMLLGGPDGLAPALRASCQESLRLSDLTLPHSLARVLLIEQLYRAWSINAAHPYHRQ